LPDLRISSWQQAGAERAAPSSPAQRPTCNRRAVLCEAVVPSKLAEFSEKIFIFAL